jgi:hypothetical protein
MRRALLLGVTFFLGFVSVPIGKVQDDTPVFPFVLPWSDATPSATDLSGWLDEHGERKEQILLEPSASGHAILRNRPATQNALVRSESKIEVRAAMAKCPLRIDNVAAPS